MAYLVFIARESGLSSERLWEQMHSGQVWRIRQSWLERRETFSRVGQEFNIERTKTVSIKGNPCIHYGTEDIFPHMRDEMSG
jgi:hypothetical protein